MEKTKDINDVLENMSSASNSMYTAHVLTDVGARSIWEKGQKVGYCLNLKINYYRGLSLSCIDQISLTIDGEDVDPNTMSVQISGREYAYTDILKDTMCTDVYWLFGELLRVVIRKPGGIEQGVHHVKLVLGTRRSYTPTMISECERDITFA